MKEINKNPNIQTLKLKGDKLIENWKYKPNGVEKIGNSLQRKVGFTLLELLIVISIIGILATTVFASVNPGRQLAKARDTQRVADVSAILATVYQYASEHSGELPDTDGDPDTNNFPTTATCIGTSGSCFDLAGAGDTGEEIVPVYLYTLPKDPKVVATGIPGTDADTGYSIYVDTNGHIHASAVGEITTSIVQVR